MDNFAIVFAFWEIKLKKKTKILIIIMAIHILPVPVTKENDLHRQLFCTLVHKAHLSFKIPMICFSKTRKYMQSEVTVGKL